MNALCSPHPSCNNNNSIISGCITPHTRRPVVAWVAPHATEMVVGSVGAAGTPPMMPHLAPSLSRTPTWRFPMAIKTSRSQQFCFFRLRHTSIKWCDRRLPCLICPNSPKRALLCPLFSFSSHNYPCSSPPRALSIGATPHPHGISVSLGPIRALLSA
jgi:hypothetical protein